MDQVTLDGGFADPVFGAQASFRAVMDALANPGQAQALAVPVESPAGLAPELAAIALTLCDHDTRVWLDPVLAENPAIVPWLRFHTAAPLTTDPEEAQFALISDPVAMPALERFALGTQEYPDRSTTVALVVPALSGGAELTLRGPGIANHWHISPGALPHDFLAQWSSNHALFPRGVDLLLVANGAVLGLPRTTRIAMETH